MKKPSKEIFYKIIKGKLFTAMIFPDGRKCQIWTCHNFKNEKYYRLVATSLNKKCFYHQFYKTMKEVYNTACLAYLDEL